MGGNDPFICCREISKSFGSVRVIENLNLEIRQGEFLSLLGPSGSGKTTLLMLLAGFESVSEGQILIGEKRIDELPPHRRDMGVVFQNYALFPHMTVAENVGFPLRMRGVEKHEIRRRVLKVLQMVELANHIDHRPAQLSGGQQQRVALARALVFEPRVVLMDEPLGALDRRLREQMQLDIRDLHRRLGLTIAFVTHDQAEALTMSDRIAVFNKGRIEQIGTPEELYDRPATKFVAEFIGETNLFEGTVRETTAAGSTVELENGLEICINESRAVGDKVTIVVRPERMKISACTTETVNCIPSRMEDRVYQGDHIRAKLSSQDLQIIAKLQRQDDNWALASEVTAHFAPGDGWVLAR